MRRSLALLLPVFIAGCSAPSAIQRPTSDGPPTASVSIPQLPGSPVPRPEPRSRYGNMAEYEVLGKRYRVMDTSAGYRETGIASWYGRKFHGRLTSNRETYNMYAMSAAHKTLPLPTYVEVRNLENNRTIIVRVNDRGPFADDRIIDLSYAAAMKLDMLEAGTARVEVKAISFDEPAGELTAGTPAVQQDFLVPDKDGPVYIQAGAYGERANAENMLERLRAQGVRNVSIKVEPRMNQSLYRVRIGPIDNVAEFERLNGILERKGINSPYVVAD